jgi:hypothetical protein
MMYAERDLDMLGEYYTRHVEAMTAEGLHDKSAIAAELAWRDKRIDDMEQILKDLVFGWEDVLRRNQLTRGVLR